MNRRAAMCVGLLIGFSVFGVVVRSALSDRGSIPYDPDVTIFEPNQRALIAWNGTEEILLLSTELHASKEVDVLEVLPLPTEPTVKKGDMKVFERAVRLINKKTALKAVFAGKGHGEGARNAEDAGEVTFEAKIGAHDISVVKVKDADHFVEWVVCFLRDKKNVPDAKVSEDFKRIIGSYVKDGFCWFVFDTVKVKKAAEQIEPIQYQFKTEKLFYPMRITSLAQGETVIDLIVLTPRMLSKFPCLPMDRIELRHDPVDVNIDEISGVSEDFAGLLRRESNCKLRIWRVSGKLSELDKDIVAE
ncbi:MAG: DUF2330 domain-containing protein [Planctomycetota bacterium]|nr:DUF2330 domain-containing protein [Planctomycetota bacterium]